MQELIKFINQHTTEAYLLALIMVLLMIIEFFRNKRSTSGIDTAKAIQLINRENANVIDLRPKETYLRGHIVDAHQLTARELEENPKKIEKFRAKPLILICGNGTESQKVAAVWARKGYNIYSLSGGMRSWVDAGLPVIKEVKESV